MTTCAWLNARLTTTPRQGPGARAATTSTMAGPPSAGSDAAGDACREYANAQAVSPHGSGEAVPRCNSAASVPAPRRRSQRLAALNTAKVHKVAQSQRAEPAAQLASSDSEDAGSAYSAGSSCGSSGGLGDSASEAAGSPVHAQRARAPPQFVRAATASPSVHEQLFRHLQCARPATPVAAGSSPAAAPASSPSLRDKLSATLKRARGQRAEGSGKGTKRARYGTCTCNATSHWTTRACMRGV